jgi:uncharacterized protein YndB with AHSA1/START domain
MNKVSQVYVTYIRSTQEKVWDAITNPETTRRYWGYNQATEWKPGAAWEHRRISDPGVAHIAGKVIEAAPPKRLVITWANAADVNNADKASRVTFELENLEDVVCLTVTHSELEPDSDMLRGISRGWPLVLSSLKSLLETGKPIDILFLKATCGVGQR